MSVASGDGSAPAQPSAARTIPLSSLVGRAVRDADGRVVGEIEELTAEIEMYEHGTSYVVTHFAIGRHRWLDQVLSGRFVPSLVRHWRRWSGYRRLEVPWQALDLSDPTKPRLRGHADQL